MRATEFPMEGARRPQPATEAEKALLGCLLDDPTGAAVGAASKAGITPQMFDDLSRAVLYRTMVQSNRAGEPLDVVSLAGKLRTARGFEGDAINLLSELMHCAPTGGLASYYFQPIKDAYLKTATWKFADMALRAASNPEETPKELKADLENHWRALFESTNEDDLPPIISATDFLARDLPAAPQVIHGVLNQGAKFVLGGGSKSFKTWVLLNLAVAVAGGKPWLSFETTPGKVLYVNFEIQEEPWQRRIKAVCSTLGIEKPDNLELLNLRGHAGDYRKLLPKIRNRARGQGFVLIILDPIYKMYGGTDENSAGDVANLLNAIEALAVESGAAVAFGAHFSKGNQSGKESIDRVSGSGVFARDPDSLMMLTRHEVDQAFVVESILRDFPSVEPFVVRWRYPLMDRDDTLDPAKLKQVAGRKKVHAAGELLDLIREEALLVGDWKAQAARLGISKSSFYRMKDELEENELVLHSKINDKWYIVTKKTQSDDALSQNPRMSQN